MNALKFLPLLALALFSISCDKQESEPQAKANVGAGSAPGPNLSELVVPEPEPKEPKHLFILFGQHNMSANLRNHFAQAIRKTLGVGAGTVALSINKQGLMADWSNHYPKLLEDVAGSLVGNSYESVSLVWMHGENDARTPSQSDYKKHFKEMLDRLRADLKSPNLKFVIGRISDTGMSGSSGAFVSDVREAQVEVADEDPNGAWVDTDDLIRMGRDSDGFHYSRNASAILGERFARKAMSQLGIETMKLDQGMSIGRPQ